MNDDAQERRQIRCETRQDLLGRLESARGGANDNDVTRHSLLIDCLNGQLRCPPAPSIGAECLPAIEMDSPMRRRCGRGGRVWGTLQWQASTQRAGPWSGRLVTGHPWYRGEPFQAV